MYFVNKRKFAVHAPFVYKANVSGVESYDNSEDIEKAYPDINVSDIPTIKPSETDDTVFLMISSHYGREAFALGFNEDIEDWIETQTESYHVEDGYLF